MTDAEVLAMDYDSYMKARVTHLESTEHRNAVGWDIPAIRYGLETMWTRIYYDIHINELENAVNSAYQDGYDDCERTYQRGLK